jgi:RNA polymerase sigma-70 factor (sigma-E family)
MTFEEYAAARLPALLRYAAVLTGSTDLAQDIVQEVLVRVHTRWHSIARLAVPDQYVRRMVTNEFLSWRRRWVRLVPVGAVAEDRRPATVADQPDAAAAHAERHAVLAELGRLPRRQQVVLVLRYYEGLSDTEIADVLGCRPATVRGYASRALATLRIGLDTGDRHRRAAELTHDALTRQELTRRELTHEEL